ncbi:DUF4344 domain-containing metallopeptidase [Leptolyngbya sp. 7M]|nr:DUF4344 domain-containing metallopeptidase [Leptolyngbya sp. 7M]QYO63788.1 DUF4344 domain-containing metallopeptidase [Leptolyngbya sp. 7M]
MADVETQAEYEDQVLNAGLFTFFYELGHTLVDQYELPITGHEKDIGQN